MRFLEQFPCPPAGQGVHAWLLGTANRCRCAGLTAQQAAGVLREKMSRPPRPSDEVQAAVAKAYEVEICHPPFKERSFVRTNALHEFQPEKLEKFASQIVSPECWEVWLRERSPIDPLSLSGYQVFKFLYQPGERIHVFDRIVSRLPLQSVVVGQSDIITPQLILDGGRDGNGIWFLANPVDGQSYPSGRFDPQGRPIFSCRDFRSIASFRYLLIESDIAASHLWIACLVQLPMRIASLATSGSRSIHCLVRIDAASREHWYQSVEPLKAPFRILGADTACFSGVRLTRLPGCKRPAKCGVQRLLFLNPTPVEMPISGFPVLRPASN